LDSFFTREELLEIGFKSVGEEVYLSRKASVYGAENMEIGNHVRIDDFCFLSGKITLKNFIHIPASAALYGGPNGIILEDFSGIAQRVLLIADSDDYSGNSLTNPTTPPKYKNPIQGPIILKRHVIVGAGSTVLPNVILEEGTAIGAMSLVTKSTEPWSINVGIPSRKIADRSKKLLELEKEFLSENR
jgi:galactoside O-acetyltransferase